MANPDRIRTIAVKLPRMDDPQLQFNGQQQNVDGGHCFPVQDGTNVDHEFEPSSNGVPEDGHMPITPEKMVEDDQDQTGDERNESSGFEHDNINNEYPAGAMGGYEKENEVGKQWNSQEDIPNQTSSIGENQDRAYPDSQQGEPEAEGICPSTQAVEGAEIVVTSPDGIQARHDMEPTDFPQEVGTTQPEPAEAVAASSSKEEDVPSVTTTPARDQRPAATSTPRTLKEKITASEYFYVYH